MRRFSKRLQAQLLDQLDCLFSELEPLAKPETVPADIRDATVRACRGTVLVEFEKLKAFISKQ